MSNPLICVDGENREMSDEETANYQALCAIAFRVDKQSDAQAAPNE